MSDAKSLASQPDRPSSRTGIVAVRIWLYAHFLAIGTAGLAVAWDTRRLSWPPFQDYAELAMLSVNLFPAFAIGYLILIGLFDLCRRDLLFVIAAGTLATLTHCLAALPAIM